LELQTQSGCGLLGGNSKGRRTGDRQTPEPSTQPSTVGTASPS
jgi:hypothetical protein